MKRRGLHHQKNMLVQQYQVTQCTTRNEKHPQALYSKGKMRGKFYYPV